MALTTADRHANFRGALHYVYTPFVQAKTGLELTHEQWDAHLTAWLQERGIGWIDRVMESKGTFKEESRSFVEWVIARILATPGREGSTLGPGSG